MEGQAQLVPDKNSPKRNAVAACVDDLSTDQDSLPGVRQTRGYRTVLAVPGSLQGWRPRVELTLFLWTQVRAIGKSERCDTATTSHCPLTEPGTHLVCALPPDHLALHLWDAVYCATPAGRFVGRCPPFEAIS